MREKKFIKNLCKILGHEWHMGYFVPACIRCGVLISFDYSAKYNVIGDPLDFDRPSRRQNAR